MEQLTRMLPTMASLSDLSFSICTCKSLLASALLVSVAGGASALSSGVDAVSAVSLLTLSGVVAASSSVVAVVAGVSTSLCSSFLLWNFFNY